MKIEYTEDEVKAAVQLFDLAVKAGGLNVAEAALVLTKKFQEAMTPKDAPKESETPSKSK